MLELHMVPCSTVYTNEMGHQHTQMSMRYEYESTSEINHRFKSSWVFPR